MVPDQSGDSAHQIKASGANLTVLSVRFAPLDPSPSYYLVTIGVPGGGSVTPASDGGPAVASMLERGLVEIEPDRIGFRARFTPAEMAGLSVMVQDRRAFDPKQYGHIREELGIDPVATVDFGMDA